MEKVSTRFSFVLIAMLVVSVVLVAFPHPNIAPIVDFIPISAKHNPEHTPNLSPEAQARVDLVVAEWTVKGPPPSEDPNLKCAVMKIGETAIRWIIWQKTGLSATGIGRGNLSWFDAEGWQDAYANKSEATLYDLPTDLRNNPNYPNVSMNKADCKDFPTLPPMAAH